MEMNQNQVFQQSQGGPAIQLKGGYSMLKMVLLGIITFGIYPLIKMCNISTDINAIAEKYDGKKTMHFALLAFVIGPITLGIGDLVWFHRISERIGEECTRRGVGEEFSAKTFWIWSVLGSMIVVGPFIYLHKLCNCMNALVDHYNTHG